MTALNVKGSIKSPYHLKSEVTNLNRVPPLRFNILKTNAVVDMYTSQETLCLRIKSGIPVKARLRPAEIGPDLSSAVKTCEKIFKVLYVTMGIFLTSLCVGIVLGLVGSVQGSAIGITFLYTEEGTVMAGLAAFILLSAYIISRLEDGPEDDMDFHIRARKSPSPSLPVTLKISVNSQELKEYIQGLRQKINELEWKNHQLKLSETIPAQGSNGSKEDFTIYMRGNYEEEAVVS